MRIKSRFYSSIGHYFHRWLQQKPKVFGIGLNRTGSSSLGIYFELLGYTHWTEVLGAEKIKRMIKDEAYLKEMMDPYEMHEDWPTAQTYRTLDQLYPDAKFILTLRESPEKWAASLINTARQERENGSLTNEVKNLVYGIPAIVTEHKDRLVEIYKAHEKDVRKYFEGRNDFLVLPVDLEISHQ